MKLRTHKKVPRKILTTQGRISYSRYVLRPADEESRKKLMETFKKKTVVPLDEVLGTDGLPFRISVAMMIEIAYWAAKLCSYQDAEDFFMKAHGIRVGDDSIRNVTNYIGRIIFEHDCREAEASYEKLMSGNVSMDGSRKGTLYLQTDGAALNTRTADENSSTWRENKLGIAFSTDGIYRWKNSRGEEQHQIMSREYVSYIGPAKDFGRHFLAMAIRAGYGQFESTVLISDGAAWIRNLRDELFPDVQQILDLFHLKENAYEFAKMIFHDDREKYEPWARDICQRLEDGKWKEVLKDIEQYKDLPSRAGKVNLYTYIQNNRNNIDYPSYRKKGYFVGSGAIESGNKVVMQSRLKLQGMRWNVPTAQCMVSIRSKIASGIWFSETVPLIYKEMGVAL